MSDDPVDIPSFLQRTGNQKSAATPRGISEREWIMPPVALGTVARAIRAGCDTMQKRRKRTRRRNTHRQIREALHAVVRSGDFTRDGRRYRSQRTGAKP